MTKKEKVKKPFYKKWWVWVIAIFIIGAIATGGGEDSSEKTEPKPASTQVKDEKKDNSQPKEEAKKAPAKEEPKDDGKIKQGTYKIGTDLPAGEYLVFATGAMGYIESAKDSTGQLESIIFNDNLSKGAHSYVTLNDGEYFKLNGGEMYPVDKAPSVKPEDGVYTNGMYKVGQDIPAGEYKVILEAASGMGYLEVASNSSHQIESIVTNENVTADMYITITDGQYIKLNGVKIEN